MSFQGNQLPDWYSVPDCLCQGIIQKNSASGRQMLPFVIFDKKVPFFPEMVLF